MSRTAQNRASVREQYSLAQRARQLQFRVGPNIEIDAAVLQSMLERRIEALDDMEVNFREAPAKWFEHLGQQPQMPGNGETDGKTAGVVAAQLLDLVAGAPHLIENGGCPSHERLSQRGRDHAFGA